MILNEISVLEIIKAKTPDKIAYNIKLQNDHKLHITGKDYDGVIEQIIGYEGVEQFKQKKILTKPFTRPLTKYIIDEQNRWKMAQGTNKYYKFTKDDSELQKTFTNEVLGQVWKGQSMDFFIKEFLSKARYQEFNGFFVVERTKVVTIDGITYETKEGITKIVDPNTQPSSYIIFVQACDVKAFDVTGQYVEYLAFQCEYMEKEGTEIEYYRVLDDKKDYIVEYNPSGKEGQLYKISEEYPPIEHKAGRCPVVNVTFRNKYLNCDTTKTSSIDELIPLLDYYLNQYANHIVSCVLHSHPIYYQLGQKCTAVHHGQQCESGRILYSDNGVNNDVECPSCKGLGHNIHKDASTVLIIPPKDENGQQNDYSNVAGYITPPIDILEHQIKELEHTKDEILQSAIGVGNVSQKDNVNNTATAVVVNMKPLEAIIADNISDIEAVETELTDIIGKLQYGDKYVGCEINYGRKLNLRDENTLLDEIAKAKASGSSYYHIKTLNEELIYTRHAKSPSDLQRNILLNELEPLVGFTFAEIESSQNIKQGTKILKQNFVDLITKFEVENGPVELYEPNKPFNERVKSIRLELDKYIEEEKLSVQPTAANSSQQQPTAAIDSLGKLPLALQQLALARTRAEESGDKALATQIGKKMDELLNEINK